MNVILTLACLLFWYKPDPSLLVLDKNLKKPVYSATGFTTTQFLEQYFPVYASEAEAIIAATDKLVKLMEREPVCYRVDSIAAGHSLFLLIQDCDGNLNYSISIITTVEESQTSYGFSIVKNEENRRKAQQKLLNFATYLAR